MKNFAKFLLAAVGLYSVLSYEIGTGTQEFGVRMAACANRFKLVAQVIRESLVLTVPGLLVGFATASVAFQPLNATG
jgi:ABC-type antimicrobial peptide transport system permease subunit